MKPCFFALRCKCKERRLFRQKISQLKRLIQIQELTKEELKRLDKKKKKKIIRRTLYYPSKTYSKEFQINYSQILTAKAKLVLMTLKNKYIYHAIDDILCILNSNKIEQKNLLDILYSTILFLYYNLNIIFFDIWIEEISFAEIEKPNNFIKNKSKLSKKITRITFSLFYKIRLPIKKPQSLW